MSWISRAYECRSRMYLPEANSTNLYFLWAACPCLSWSVVAMCVLTWVVFVPQASRRRCTPVVALHRHIITCTKLPCPRTFSLHEIFKCVHLKFTVYGRKHTYTQLPQCSHASVGLAQARPNYAHISDLLFCTFPQPTWKPLYVCETESNNFSSCNPPVTIETRLKMEIISVCVHIVAFFPHFVIFYICGSPG